MNEDGVSVRRYEYHLCIEGFVILTSVHAFLELLYGFPSFSLEHLVQVDVATTKYGDLVTESFEQVFYSLLGVVVRGVQPDCSEQVYELHQVLPDLRGLRALVQLGRMVDQHPQIADVGFCFLDAILDLVL